MRTTTRLGLMMTTVALVLAACGGGPGTDSPESNGGPDEVLIALSWLIGGQDSMWFVGIEKGFFAEENISATIVRGHGSGDTVRRLSTKGADFGVSDAGAMIAAASEGVHNVKAVYAIYSNPPHSVYFNAAEISEPKDLEGKTLAGAASSSTTLMFPLFAAENGIDVDKVTWNIVDPAAVHPALLSGEVDGIGDYSTSVVPMLMEADNRGLEIDAFHYGDYGLNFYSNVLMAHDDTISENPDLVRRLLAALRRSHQYTLDNPEEAVEIFNKYHREPPVEEATLMLEAGLTHSVTEESLEHGLGFIDAERWAYTVDVTRDALDLGSVPDDLFTTEFLP